jgi:hypothetical protein
VRKAVESAVRDRRWSDLELSYGANGHSCPYCGARQSWDPLDEPAEPMKTVHGKSNNLGCFIGGCVFAGVVVGLVFYLIQSFGFQNDDPWLPFAAPIVVGLIVGIVLGLRSDRDEEARSVETYSERIADYRRNRIEYEAFQNQLASRPVLSEPEVDYSTASYSPTKWVTSSMG